jgi:hypothetical protein
VVNGDRAEALRTRETPSRSTLTARQAAVASCPSARAVGFTFGLFDVLADAPAGAVVALGSGSALLDAVVAVVALAAPDADGLEVDVTSWATALSVRGVFSAPDRLA